MMIIRDVMTPTVVTVNQDTPLKDVARLLLDHAISGVPVVDSEGSVVGVVSEADLLVKEQGPDPIRHRPLAGLLSESRTTRDQLLKLSAVTAAGAMTSPAITIALTAIHWGGTCRRTPP